MGRKWILHPGLFLILVVSLDICKPAETLDTKDVKTSDSLKPFQGPFRPIMRRRIIRKRIIEGEDGANATNVSVSMSMSTSRKGEPSSKVIFDETLPSPEAVSDGPFRRPFGKFRPAFMNRSRSFSDFKPTMEPRETPSVSFREFRITMRPRLGFGRQKSVSSTTEAEPEEEEENEEEETPKPTTTMRPFPVKKPLKGKLKRKTTTTTTTEESVVDDNEIDEGQTEEDDDNNIGTDSSSSQPSITTSDQSTTDTPTTAVLTTTPPSTENAELAAVTEAAIPGPLKNSSMIIIPVPPSQRKPYHPVIMQVTKSPMTAESLPETRVVTYKLNKMFVPMGIYGKVLTKSPSQSDLDVITENSIVSTPLPFLLPGQESPEKLSKSSGKESTYLRTPTPEIKVKGHRSKEVEEPMLASGDSSTDFASAVAYASRQKEHHEKQQKQWESMMEKLKQKQRNLADSISLTYQNQRRPNIKDISLTTEKVDVGQISLTTEESANYEVNRREPPWTIPNKGYSEVGAPRPYRPYQAPGKTILNTLTNAASSIPGLIHGGFTSLTSGYGTTFEDEDRFPGSSQPTFVASESQVQVANNNPSSPDIESLEYFRKRPHLLNKNRGKSNFLPPEYSSGFKPVTAPPHFASQYYASTPKQATPQPFRTPTSSAGKSQREPLYESPNSLRNAKQFLSSNDLNAWKASVFGNSEADKGFSVSSTTRTPRTTHRHHYESSTPKSFADQWFEFNKKYSKYEIDEAKDKIYNLFSESRSDLEDMMYMKPPNEATKTSGSAFDDLLKMFRMGFSFGAGHSASKKPMVSYAAGMHADDSFQASSGDGWRPLSKPIMPGTRIISFNAGVTFGGKPTKPTSSSSTPGYSGFGSGSHYSSSVKPYVPKSKYKEHYNGNTHLISDIGGKELRSKYQNNGAALLRQSPPPDYLSNTYYSNYKTDITDGVSADDGSETNKHPRFEISPAIATHFTPSSSKPNLAGLDRNKLDAILGNMKYMSDQAIEIIPSSEFFKQNGNMADIAAVIKPPELSDELVKAALPPQISSVPQLSYPTQQLIQNPQGFTSLSQLQQYFATAQPQQPLAPTHAYNQVIPHSQFHSQIPQQQQVFFHQGGFIPQGVPQFLHQFQVPQYPQSVPIQQQQQQQQQHQQSSQIKAAGESVVGFSDFQLPAGVDPDIAALLRAELSKDDIPEEYRKDFIEAQEQEKAKQQQKQRQGQQEPQASGSRLRVNVIKPGQDNKNKQPEATKRSDTKPDIKFHKPIPISPTMLTPTKGKPIRASPVPRYVVELARKLKTDKDVQGIVRVSTKRNRGPPIEYLYPVRG